MRGRVEAVELGSCGEEKRVSGDGESGDGCDGQGVMDLSLADPQESFFIAEVDFDVPPPEIVLEDVF